MKTQAEVAFLAKMGEHIRKIRKSKRMSYGRVSLNCDLDTSLISRIEKGKVNPTIYTLHELAIGLRIPTNKLLEFVNEETVRPTPLDLVDIKNRIISKITNELEKLYESVMEATLKQIGVIEMKALMDQIKKTDKRP